MHSSSPSISQLPDSDYTLSFENSPSNRHSIFLFSGTSFNPSRLCDDRSPQPTNFKSKPPPYKPLFSFFSSTPCFYFSSNLFPLSLCAPFFPIPQFSLFPKGSVTQQKGINWCDTCICNLLYIAHTVFTLLVLSISFSLSPSLDNYLISVK